MFFGRPYLSFYVCWQCTMYLSVLWYVHKIKYQINTYRTALHNEIYAFLYKLSEEVGINVS